MPCEGCVDLDTPFVAGRTLVFVPRRMIQLGFNCPNLVNQGTAADTELLGGLGAISAAFGQCRQDSRPLHGGQAAFVGGGLPVRGNAGG